MRRKSPSVIAPTTFPFSTTAVTPNRFPEISRITSRILAYGDTEGISLNLYEETND